MKKPETVDGRPCIAGTNIVAQGFAKVATGQAIGGVVGLAVSSRGKPGEASPLKKGEKGYLALTDDELLLMSVGGMVTLKPKDVKVRVPRRDVASMTMGDGKMLSPLTVTFADGSLWQVEAPKAAFGNARDLVRHFEA